MVSHRALNPYAQEYVPPSLRGVGAYLSKYQKKEHQSNTPAELPNFVPCAIRPDEFYCVGGSIPPIISKSNCFPSLGFAKGLIEGLSRVPIRLRKAVSDWGYKIVTATTMPEVLPQRPINLNRQYFTNLLIATPIYKRVQQLLKSTNWWQACLSHHPESPKTIMMPEQGWASIGVVHKGNWKIAVNPEKMGNPPAVMVETYEYVPIEAPGVEHTMLHEFGHAVDDYLGKVHCRWNDGQARLLSMSNVFEKAYVADIKALTDPELKRYFAYYLPREDNPQDIGGEARTEAFAELFACALAEDINPDVKTLYQQNFPNVYKFIQKHVIKPWMRDAASSGQAAKQDS